MNLSKRERILGGLILILLLGWLIGEYGVLQIYRDLSSSSTELNKEKAKYEDYLAKMKKSKRIQKVYWDIVGKDSNTGLAGGEDPKKAFSEFVADLCRRLGFSYPRIEPAKVEPIEGVNDYSFITLTVTSQGNLETVSKLLKGFEREAVLIRELEINSHLDSTRTDVSITVARMVQTGGEKKEETSRKKEEGTRPSSIQSRTDRKAIPPKEEN